MPLSNHAFHSTTRLKVPHQRFVGATEDMTTILSSNNNTDYQLTWPHIKNVTTLLQYILSHYIALTQDLPRDTHLLIQYLENPVPPATRDCKSSTSAHKYQTPWLNDCVPFSNARLGHIAIMMLLAAYIWIIHRSIQDMAGDIWDGKVVPPWRVYVKHQLAMQWQAVVCVFVLVSVAFMATDESSQEQMVRWLWWSSVTVGSAIAWMWAIWFLGYWIWLELAKFGSRDGEEDV